MSQTARIIVLGGGIIGLSTAMLLAKQGHDVTVCERDAGSPPTAPTDAWEAWDRPGVVQFRQPHYLHSAGRLLLDQYLPEVSAALQRSGGLSFDLLQLMPPTIADRSRRVGDERFVTVTGRRAVMEYAAASAAEECGVRVLRGAGVAGLLARTSRGDGIPHVTGIRLASGDEIQADLVIDATGRRSRLPELLTGVGAPPPHEEGEESGFIYYTRFFQGSSVLPKFRTGLLSNFDSFSLLVLPSDANTWSVTVFLLSGDPQLKVLRHLERWTRLIEACPAHAQWLEGTPISDVLPMGGVTDRIRRLIVDGRPVATGIVAVGDAWACTNPVGGRGITMGLIGAVGTADVVREHIDDPLALAFAHDAMLQARVTPWYQSTVAGDRQRAAQIKAAVQGTPQPRPSSPMAGLPIAMLYDATLFRAAMEIVSLLALPSEVMARPGIVDRIMEVVDIHEPPIVPGPTRAELLQLLA